VEPRARLGRHLPAAQRGPDARERGLHDVAGGVRVPQDSQRGAPHRCGVAVVERREGGGVAAGRTLREELIGGDHGAGVRVPPMVTAGCEIRLQPAVKFFTQRFVPTTTTS
jgi:hypothetical protein